MAGESGESFTSWLRRYVGQRRIFIIGTLAAIHDAAGRVLLMQRADNGEWDFPGGVMELGETLTEALTREVAEETGLMVEPIPLLAFIRLLRITTTPIRTAAKCRDGRRFSSAASWAERSGHAMARP